MKALEVMVNDERSALLAQAKRMGLDAYESKGTVRVLDHRGGWQVVTSGRVLGRIKSGFHQAKQAAQWLTRSTRHPFAY